MATFKGTAGGGGRVPYVDVTILSRSTSSATVRYVVRSNPVSGYATWGTFSGTLKVNGSSYAVSGGVTKGVANNIWHKDITYNNASAFTLSVSLTGKIAGTTGWTSTSLSGSTSVAAGIAKPGKPSGFKFTRTSDTALTISFTKGSGASSTQITASKNVATWYNLANPTGSSQTVSSVTVNSYWRFQAYSKNAAGNSATVGPYTIYTKPATPKPPTLASGGKVSWNNNAAYVHGVEVQRTDDGGSTTTQVSLGAVTSWTDPTAQQPLTQYRVRFWAGPSVDVSKTFSNWSNWSENAMARVYKAPSFSSVTVERAQGGVGNPMGTGALIKMKGTVTPPSLVEGNTWKIEYRHKLSTNVWPTPESWTVLKQNQIAATFDESFTLPNDTFDVDKTYDFEVRVSDVYKETLAERTIPVGSVALSVSKTGIGAGKIWERGALDVGGDAYIEGDLVLSDPNVIVIDGQRYQRTGSASGTADVNITNGSLYRSDPIYVQMPVAPPEGWRYVVVSACTSNRTVWSSGLALSGQTATANFTLHSPTSRPGSTWRAAWSLQKA